MISLLGAHDFGPDGVADYCSYLARSLRRHGVLMETVRVPWPELGWLVAFVDLWKRSKPWRHRWVILHYTALLWSRRGFSLLVIPIAWIVRIRGARLAVLFHDSSPYVPRNWIGMIRQRCQTIVMRRLCKNAEVVITTIAPECMPWLSQDLRRVACIPVGANLPQLERASSDEKNSFTAKSVVVFSFDSGPAAMSEIETIAYVVRKAAEHVPALTLRIVGRNSEIARAPLEQMLAGTRIELSCRGVLPAEEVAEVIFSSSVLLFVRGSISSRRGSAIAGIVMAVPVVAFAGSETAHPITESGAILVPLGDRDSLAGALSQVLLDESLAAELVRQNQLATDQYFSWDAIARRYIGELDGLVI